MAEVEETPQQRQARIRREKREAKIKAGGSERLDKITALSGRTPESMRRESNNVSPALTPTHSATSTSAPASQTQPQERSTSDPPEVDLRSLLAQAAAEQQNHTNAEDPMIKLMESFMGPISQMGGDPNDPGANEPLQLDPDAIAKATGLPSFLVNQFVGGKERPRSSEEASHVLRWKIVHIVFSFLLGIYALLSITTAMDTFSGSGEGLPDQPLPAPATIQNPWWIFLAGELMLQSARRLGGETVAGGYGSFKDIYGVSKDIARDGSIVVFVIGMATFFGVLQA